MNSFLRTALIAVCPLTAWADGQITYSAKNYHAGVEAKTIEMFEDVHIEYHGQLMTADKVIVNQATNHLVGTGHVKVSKDTLVITGDRAEIDLNTGFGTFYNAILRRGQSLYVEGKELSSYAENRYRARQGKVSMCRDCPQSWSVTGAYMDIETEGFIEAHHAVIQIRDVPVVYLPFYIFPVKTKRQSGFLVPRYFMDARGGNSFDVPYFQVLSEDADTTFNYQYYTNAGHRFVNEVRYAYSSRSYVQSTQSLQYVSAPPDSPFQQDRRAYGLVVDQRLQLTDHTVQRFRAEVQSTPIYSVFFPYDYPSYRLPALEVEPSLSWQSGTFFAYGLMRNYGDNLPRSNSIVKPGADQIDPTTGLLKANSGVTPFQGMVHNWPELGASATNFGLLGPIRMSSDLRLMGFHRGGASRDLNTTWGTLPNGAPDTTNWIREGDRTTLNLRFTAPQRFFSILNWKPSVEIRGDAYTFQVPGAPASAMRARYLVDQTLGATMSRVWSADLGDLKAVKHEVTPYVRWSYSDRDWTTQHPFFDQGLATTNHPGAPQFDIFDPNGEAPQGSFGTATEEQRIRQNQLFTFALATRVLGRFGTETRRIDTLLAADMSQDLDLYHRDEQGRPSLGLFRANVSGGYAGIGLSSSMAHDWKLAKTDYNHVVSYTWSVYSVNASQTIQAIQKDSKYYGLGAEVRALGPLALSGSYKKDVTAGLTEQSYRISYAGGEAQCFYFNLAVSKGYGSQKFDFLPEVGFIISEAGEHKSVGSFMSRGELPR
ncbi:MAG: LPS-assembly protein LptD [Bdellovibrionales bacterium]|nr:LPS-assembly protein LptD [Bdellovibrionales bacterium]